MGNRTAIVFLCHLMLLISCSGGTENLQINTNDGVAQQETVLGEIGLPFVVDTFQQKNIATENFVQNGQNLPVDIIFVIDDSISMIEEQAALQNAALTVVQATQSFLPGVDARISAIGTTTFGTADPTFADKPEKYNPFPTLGEIFRESWCGPVGKFIPSTTIPSNCETNWVVNSAAGYVSTKGSLNGVKYVTGAEPDAQELSAKLLNLGVAGHWLESPLMSIMMFINNTSDDLVVKRPTARSVFIAITDANDDSDKKFGYDGCGAPGTQCIGEDSRPIPVLGSTDYKNPGYYKNPLENFYSDFKKFKNGLVDLHLIAGLPGISLCDPEIEEYDTRISSIIQEHNLEHPDNLWIRGDICNLQNYNEILKQIAAQLSQELSKQYNLAYAGSDSILSDTVAVAVNGQSKQPFQFIAETKTVLLGEAAPLGAQITITYWAPQVSGFELSEAPNVNSIEVFRRLDNGTLEPLGKENWQYIPGATFAQPGSIALINAKAVAAGGLFEAHYLKKDVGEI